MKRKKKIILIVALSLVGCLLLGVGLVFGINAYVKSDADKRIISEDKAATLKDIDCILVLGCKVNGDTPSTMLSDRLRRGIALYENGTAPKILVSGDHGTVTYDEVNTMKAFAIEKGVPSEDIFMDHAGFSTYESIYRAKEVFGVKRMVIVTQKYHLYRALYVAKSLGIEAYGVASDYQWYYSEFQRNAREVLARNKDFFTTLFNIKPTYLGEAIPISGNGDQTNDKK